MSARVQLTPGEAPFPRQCVSSATGEHATHDVDNLGGQDMQPELFAQINEAGSPALQLAGIGLALLGLVAISRQIRDIFAEHTPIIEPLSLDEAYLDVTENLQGIPLARVVAGLLVECLLMIGCRRPGRQVSKL